MQYDNSDDPFGFWDDEPTRALTRTHVGARSHGDTAATTRMIPVVRTEHGADHRHRPGRHAIRCSLESPCWWA